MNLERLAYVSHSTNPDETLSDVPSILEQSIRNNRPNNISGALAVTAAKYAQLLEGSHGSLDVLLLKLAMDPRHRDMVIIDRIPIEHRLFAEWEMISPPFTPEGALRLAKIVGDETPSMTDLTELIFEMAEERTSGLKA